MLRNILVSAIAAATLAGCATGYSYRNGASGDYYYGQPRTEYRYHDPYGYYGGSGGYTPGYYYDRYGRLVYGNPWGYYGVPYGYGGQWWWSRPRPPQHGGGHDHGNDHDHEGDGSGHDRDGRRPPWRNIGGVLPPDARPAPDRDDARPRLRRQQAPASAMPARPMQRESRPMAPPPVRMRSDDGGGSRMGRVIRNARASSSTDE